VEEREDRLLTVAEVAKYFRVDPESVRRWLREGKILGINLGRAPGWRIRLGDLEAFIEERHTRRKHRPGPAANAPAPQQAAAEEGTTGT